jgi:sec-independent protein translocase protein TatA
MPPNVQLALRPQGMKPMPSIGPLEIAVVLIVALLILGPKRLPDVGRSVGRGMREFKDAITGSGHGEPTRLAEASVHDEAESRTAA